MPELQDEGGSPGACRHARPTCAACLASICDCGSLCDCGHYCGNDCCEHSRSCGLSKQLQRERIDAKNGLENYATSIKNILNSERVADKISGGDKQKMLDAVNGVLKYPECQDESPES